MNTTSTKSTTVVAVPSPPGEVEMTETKPVAATASGEPKTKWKEWTKENVLEWASTHKNEKVRACAKTLHIQDISGENFDTVTVTFLQNNVGLTAGLADSLHKAIHTGSNQPRYGQNLVMSNLSQQIKPFIFRKHLDQNCVIEEIKSCYNQVHSSFDFKVIQHHYIHSGGVPRYVFQEVKDISAYREAIASITY
ncbi:hypothetical protein DFA_01653 [Cavenderia fasciculata]|uniref:SAM domain-containing protein n=1 Tax=Cavenderia fasciculata TaxID=261658 RepID=F4PTZ9_CACFS|nr:uncharacterized protein DFA_01653 [Cavenderia fasciculata]EGG21767.1 hypothetical protein DFA_01653 [Cavenderia fasciculata]|eukprot:XP_004359617.1 hypothetical protein DFA_01653 [Cavenderia fasciculata]